MPRTFFLVPGLCSNIIQKLDMQKSIIHFHISSFNPLNQSFQSMGSQTTAALRSPYDGPCLAGASGNWIPRASELQPEITDCWSTSRARPHMLGVTGHNFLVRGYQFSMEPWAWLFLFCSLRLPTWIGWMIRFNWQLKLKTDSSIG